MSNSHVLCFDNMVLKIEKQNDESNHEYLIMTWLDGKICVPKVLYFDKIEDITYLLMSKINGQMLCSKSYLENPNKLASLLAKGLKMLWDIDISDCPYSNYVDKKLQLAEIRIANNLCELDNVEPDTYGENGFNSPTDLLFWLKDNKPAEDPVFSHGDYCLPNVFATGEEITGFIDLGRSEFADKYQDIALCYRSLKHNFCGKYSNKKHNNFNPNILFKELGIVPDWKLIKYYILLDELF